jgi:DNA polymerase III delta subunit
MTALPEAWLKAEQVLVHGEDGDGRRLAVEAWKSRHVDPEWADFSLTVCREGCLWTEVVSALSEAAPLGAARVVVVPQADNLLAKPKDLPPPVQALLKNPIPDTRLLLICRGALLAGPGRSLGAKPWSDWMKEGRVLKVGVLEAGEGAAFVESLAREKGLRLDMGLASTLVARVGGNPGVLRRTLEMLDLLAEDRKVDADRVNQATFRLAEQNLYAWSQAWQKGQAAQALAALRQALEDEPLEAPLQLLGQARREVDRLGRLLELRESGQPSVNPAALGLGPKQAWLVEGLQRTLDRIRPAGLRRLMAQVNQADRDLKGMTIPGSGTALTSLTLELCRAWGGR